MNGIVVHYNHLVTSEFSLVKIIWTLYYCGAL